MSDICPSCGGYTGNGAIVRRMPAANAAGEPYPIAEVPPVKLCTCNRIAGSFLVGDGWDQGEIVPEIESAYFADVPRPEIVSLPKGASVYPIALPLSEDALRKMIEDAVQRALYPGGTISVHEHRRVEMVEESGKRWRGVLHRVDENATDPEIPAQRGHRG